MIPPLPPTLHQAIRQLSQDHPKWGTRDRAFGRCTEGCTALLPERLRRPVRFLCRSHPEWGTPAGATDECLDASRELQRLLADLGEHAEIIHAPVHRPGNGDPCPTHYVVSLSRHRLMIDLTARQFDADAPFPHITPIGSSS